MHYEILIEDESGKTALNILLPKILGNEHTFKINAYKGVGRIPKNLDKKNAKTTSLLNKLPGLIKGYSKTYQPNYKYEITLFIIFDLDKNNLSEIKESLNKMMDSINSHLTINFCLAIEEGESWLLGDIPAIKTAYPNAKSSILSNYENDSICGTWEVLANAIYSGGAKTLKNKGFQEIGYVKSEWAKNICPYMDINNNLSPSFNYLKNKLEEFM